MNYPQVQPQCKQHDFRPVRQIIVQSKADHIHQVVLLFHSQLRKLISRKVAKNTPIRASFINLPHLNKNYLHKNLEELLLS